MSNLNDLLKLAGLAARPEVAQAAPAQAREFKAGIGESQVQEDDVEEGNEFTGAMAKAKAAGHDEFEVDGKKYKVQEAAKPDFLDLDNDGDEEESMADAADDAELQEESSGYYYEKLAQEVFDTNPNLDTSGRADEFLNAAFPLLVRDMGSKKKANSILNYDPDFAADLVSAYGELKRSSAAQPDDQDAPFDGGHPADAEHKDEFGNTIKHMAQHLAKKGMKSVSEQGIDESSDECEVCHETPCVCEQPVVSESPTMDTTQLIHLMKLSGISEEAIQQKLDEWANTPTGVGEVEPTVHGDAYDFAQSVNLSLKRYLAAQDMKVQVAEHKVEKLKSLYEEFKKKK